MNLFQIVKIAGALVGGAAVYKLLDLLIEKERLFAAAYTPIPLTPKTTTLEDTLVPSSDFGDEAQSVGNRFEVLVAFPEVIGSASEVEISAYLLDDKIREDPDNKFRVKIKKPGFHVPQTAVWADTTHRMVRITGSINGTVPLGSAVLLVARREVGTVAQMGMAIVRKD